MTDRVAHQPVERSHWMVAAEVALTASAAYLAGLCVAIAAANELAPAVQISLGAVAVAILLGYGIWFLGGAGTLLAAMALPLLILSADALLITSGFLELDGAARLLGPGLAGPVPALLATLAAATALVVGLLIPGPRRHRGDPLHRHRAVASPILGEGAILERLGSAESVPPTTARPQDALWLDDTTEEDGLMPLPLDQDPLAEPLDGDAQTPRVIELAPGTEAAR